MTSADELQAIAEKELQKLEEYRFRIHICGGTGCISSRSEDVLAAFQKEVTERGLAERVLVKRVGCMGLCAAGPIVSIQPAGILYKEVTPADVPEIVASLDGQPLARLLIPTDLPFFYRQEKNTLENSGVIDPERIEDYIAAGGYTALVKALTEMTPAQVIQEVSLSGLRGRGGAGFPTSRKWQTVAKASDPLKYVVCNADEGDPGAFMDRSIFESDPHLVLEGMALAAYAVGASRGVIYVRAEYPLAVKRLKTAIKAAERMGLLGNQISATDFSFQVELRLGAGAFVCGEETALMHSV